MAKKLIGFEYPPEEIVVQNQVRVAYCGAWLSREDAEAYREEFFAEFGQDIDDGNLVVLQDDITFINAHHVVRILAQNAQLEMNLDLE